MERNGEEGMRLEGAGDWPLLAAVPHVIGPNYRLADIARALDRSVQSLRALAGRGEFPRLFRVSRNDWRVEKAALERWASGCWQDGEQHRLRADAVRRSIRQPARLRRGSA